MIASIRRTRLNLVPTTDPHLIHSAWRFLHGVMFALVAALVILAVVRHPVPLTVVAAAVFVAVLALWEWARIRGHNGPWFVALNGAFALFLWTTPDASFLAFPLFFALTHAHGGKRAVVEVGVLALVTIAMLTRTFGLALGSLIGPVIAAVVALAVGLGFRLFISESQARADAIAELIDARARATDMARHAGELTERTRLAGEIHDTVAQGLSSINLLLHSAQSRAEALGDEELQRVLQLARDTAAENLVETRRIIAALQPEPLVGATLPVALARVCSTTPMGAAVHFQVDGSAYALSDDVEATLLRATQSLLANVVSHAQATAASVTLTYQEDETAVDVVDNGIGFEPAETRPDSFGLQVLRRRLSDHGGELTIESAPGSGTGIRVRIPRKVTA